MDINFLSYFDSEKKAFKLYNNLTYMECMIRKTKQTCGNDGHYVGVSLSPVDK